jgi:uncharacterized protein (DUF1800 family)
MSLNGQWAPYHPDDRSPWNLRRVVHLHRRAGFSATWSEIDRDLKEGPSACIDRFVSGQANTAAPPDFTATARLLADSAITAADIHRLKACWFYRMLFGPDPLGEKLTLLWHDHFATANSKVQNPALMRQQNDTFRKHARSRLTGLLNASVREPALLLYLDAEANRKGHPNENLARELMELFTLGAGHFSETDVKEAARALTGWSVEDDRFAEMADRRDEGSKTILGNVGQWAGSDLVRILLAQPATAERIAVKLCRLFFGENIVPSEAVKALADGLREHDLDIGWATSVILKSDRFFADANLGSRVLSPVEYVVGSVRALELIDPAPSTLALADWSGRMGQELFEPPNVGGWPGGRVWLNTRTMIVRANFVTALMAGPNVGRSTPYDPAGLARKYGFASDPGGSLVFHHRLFFGVDPCDELRKRLAGVDAQKVMAVLLSSPEGQLG